MIRNTAIPGREDTAERNTVPAHILGFIQGMLQPYNVAWDRVYESITAPANVGATVSQDSFLSTEELCRLLHVSRVTIFRYMRAGKIKSHKLGRRNLYSVAEVMAAVKGGTVDA